MSCSAASHHLLIAWLCMAAAAAAAIGRSGCMETVIALMPHVSCMHWSRKKCRKTLLWGFLLGSLALLFCSRGKLFPNFFSLPFCSRNRGVKAVLSHRAGRTASRGHGEDLWILAGRMEGPVSSEGWRRRMAAHLWDKEAGEEEKERFPPQTPASSPSPWSITEPFHLPPTDSLPGTSGSPSQVPRKLLFCLYCWSVPDLFHLTNGLQRRRMKITLRDTFGQKPGDRAWLVKAEVSAAKGNPNKVPPSSLCEPI